MKIIAFDIGGTAIKYGIFESETLISSNEIATEAQKGGESIFSKICDVINENEDIEAISISTAGQVNPILGKIIYANENIPNYTGLEWKSRLEQLYNVEVFVENDVNSMALGEAYFGAGKNDENLLCLTFGTGVGGALIIGKKIYYGSRFSAGEFGALVTHGSVKKESDGFFDGCYEKYASVTALVENAKKIDEKYTNGRIIFENINKPEVKSLIDDWIDEIVLGLTSIVHLFNPSKIILGGGVMKQEYVISNVRRLTIERVMPNYRNVEIENAKLDNLAGIYGAVSKVLFKN